jgi:hypothetical protein
MKKLTVGIVTFKQRRELVKRLVERVRLFFPENEVDIILAVNGNNSVDMDDDYRNEMLNLSLRHKNVYPIICPEFKSLSKLWNTIVIFSKTEYNLILCDDTELLNQNIYQDVLANIENANDFFTINWVFSHFLCTKTILDDVGYFDERFSAYGYEDMDMHYRYIRKYQKNIKNVMIPGIFNRAEYSLYTENLETFVHNKPRFCDEVVKLMYINDKNGIVHPMDVNPITKVWEDKQQYPYEKFVRNNAHNIAKFDKVVLDD